MFEVDDTLDRSVLSAEVARTVLPPTGGSVLDVGCGGGRAAMSLVPPAERVIGVDQNPAMLAAFTTAAADAGARSITIEGTWPDAVFDTPVADVVTCHHVAYNVAEIEPFIGALTGRARLAVVLVIPTVHPMTAWNNAWRRFWNIERPAGPTSDDFAAVLAEMGLDAERWEMPRPPLSRHTSDPATQVPSTLRRLCLGEDRADDVADFLALHEPDWPMVHSVFRWPGEAD
ncbi:class I SAM-dependent methyltransferase [Ilumatobacter nonamiensis]|uniref:class I SAM-dependent methyltransferase n=1 Tax=Ilumatobacter nonamiensis TaxID=467093 RepID=UPI0003498DC8|nr:methyltransferase domain-containing protein [Ilumatobacter nonamiensis]